MSRPSPPDWKGVFMPRSTRRKHSPLKKEDRGCHLNKRAGAKMNVLRRLQVVAERLGLSGIPRYDNPLKARRPLSFCRLSPFITDRIPYRWRHGYCDAARGAAFGPVRATDCSPGQG